MSIHPKNIRALIVGDNADSVRLILRILERSRWTSSLHYVPDLLQALLFPPCDPNIIIIDSDLVPDREGYSKCQDIRKNRFLDHVGVLYMGWGLEEEEKTRIRTLKGTAVLTKPYQPHQLLREIEKLIDDSKSC